MKQGDSQSPEGPEDLQLEQVLRRVSWRRPPPEWRAGILASAAPVAATVRSTQRRSAVPWWNAGWGLAAAAWALVVAMNLLAGLPVGETIASRPPPSAALVELLREQRLVVALGAISVLTTAAPRTASQ